jgi:hypothetical protein
MNEAALTQNCFREAPDSSFSVVNDTMIGRKVTATAWHN